MERRTVLERVTVGVAAVGSASLAGCSGDGDSTAGGGPNGSSTESDDDQTTGGTTDDQTTGDTTVDDPTESGGDQTTTVGPMVELAEPAYEFSEGESYTYESEWNGTSGEQGWEVLSVSGDELTIRRTYHTNEGQETVGISADSGRMYEEMLLQIPGHSFFRNMREAQFYAGVDEFAPGNTFAVDTSEKDGDYDSEIVEVTGEATVNGIQCTEYTVTSSRGGIVRTVSAADGYPFPLSLHFEQAGVQLLDATLVDANR